MGTRQVVCETLQAGLREPVPWEPFCGGPGQGCGKDTGTATTTLTRVLSQPHRRVVGRHQESYTTSQSWFSRHHRNGGKPPCFSELLESVTQCATRHGKVLDKGKDLMNIRGLSLSSSNSACKPHRKDDASSGTMLSPGFHGTGPVSIHVCRATKRMFPVHMCDALHCIFFQTASPPLPQPSDLGGLYRVRGGMGALTQLPLASEGPRQGAC